MDKNRKRKHEHVSTRHTAGSGDGESSTKARRVRYDAPQNHPSPTEPGGSSRGPPRDWRRIICLLMNVPATVEDERLELMLGECLEESALATDSSDSGTSLVGSSVVLPPQRKGPCYQILHRIQCFRTSRSRHVYSEEPFLLTSDDAALGSHLAGRNQVSDIQRFIERNPDLSFVTIREYLCCSSAIRVNPSSELHQTGESTIITSPDLCDLLNRFRETIPNGAQIFSKFAPGGEVVAFFHLLYHHVSQLSRFFDDAQAHGASRHQQGLLDYIHQHKSIEYEDVSNYLGKAEICTKYVPYLFHPGSVYVMNSPQGDDYARGVLVTTRPVVNISWHSVSAVNDATPIQKLIITVEYEGEVWDFDGCFQRTAEKSVFNIVSEWNGVTSFSNLPLYPFNYANEVIKNTLTRRGEMVWKCRFGRYISYSGWDPTNQAHYLSSRFMVDFQTYRASVRDLNPQSTRLPENLLDHLGEEAMKSGNPPSYVFLLTLPVILPGFSMDDKQWRQLLVSRMSDVVWDDTAFQSLVVSDDTKDVIRALVTHRVASPLSPDLIRGKGSGLILLLHGPPGTGKTLTAERQGIPSDDRHVEKSGSFGLTQTDSVAEHSRKPLYRVTCGDIGTKPEAVERYLNGVLRMAKAWDSVVLLDEAEVFLQERSLTDLERNALVSVFLRVLEYHDGILILTSNRVGTLDEGFRSRIQLALEYPKLDSNSRRRVWGNFIERLENNPAESADLDLRDLRQNLSRLSNYELNGREIRNAINVARPLALSAGTQVDFKCLQTVIGVQRRFLRYIEDVNEGLDDEKVAREEGKR